MYAAEERVYLLEQELIALGVKPSKLESLDGPMATERSSAGDVAASRRRAEGGSSPVDRYQADADVNDQLEDVGPPGGAADVAAEGRATPTRPSAPPSTPQVGGSQFSEEGHGLDNRPENARPEDLQPSHRAVSEDSK